MYPSKPSENTQPPVAAPLMVDGVPVSSCDRVFQSQPLVQWSSGLFWCPCITFGQIADIVDRGSPSCGASGALYTLILILTGCQCIYSCIYRSKLRAQYALPEDPCADLLIHCCCEPCALCQVHRELRNRGFDMSIGWHANMERGQGQRVAQAMQPPAMQGAMYH